MVSEELKNYVKDVLASGRTHEEIRQALLGVGWQEVDINEVFKTFEISAPRRPVGYLIFVGVIVLLLGAIFFLWQDRLDLSDTNTQKVRDFYSQMANSKVSFTDAGTMVFPDEQKFLSQKTEYVFDKKNFVEVNLRTMRLTLYENGAPIKEMAVLTKGKEGSWWETPTGNYSVLGKEINHFSSIGKVWMPYSIQFYGNFFIHGWPHYDDGTAVAPSYSGGCIRLSNEDAKEVFNFTEKEMPVLVLENKETVSFGLLKPKAKNAPLPDIKAESFLISDLASGEVILEKNANKILPIASLTKFMTGVVAHEMIYLGKSIKVTPRTLASAIQIFNISVGEYYQGFDLLYPLLMQSSNDAAKTLSAFLGEQNFVYNMNAKAMSLEMKDTKFADASGISAQNISTAGDISKLLQYIYYKRHFLFDISRGKVFDNVGLIKIGGTVEVGGLKNFNEFADEPDLIGMKNGETKMAGQTIATVWNIHTTQGDLPVAVIVLNSQNRAADTKNLLRWLKENFEVI